MAPARHWYLTLGVMTIAIGLAVHGLGLGLGARARDIVGDALWAAMMFWWVSLIAPGAGLRIRAAVALGICFAVEASQLYHSPGIDAVRETTMGRLVLGSGFDPRDFAAYFIGVLVALIADRAQWKDRRRRS
jgi:hypothetical protein